MSSRAESPAIRRLALAVRSRGGRASVEFWASTARVAPLLEDDGVVTFLWRDDSAAEVLLYVDRLTDPANLAASSMHRVPGTDVWHLSYRMDADWRASYCFVPRRRGTRWPWTHGDPAAARHAVRLGRVDPLNRSRLVARAGREMSVVALPEAPPQPWLAPRPGVPRGQLSQWRAPGWREVGVYEPPPVQRQRPSLVVVLDGEAWSGSHGLATTFDNLLADRLVRPAVLVLVGSGGPERRRAEMGPEAVVGDWIVQDLLPWVRTRFGAGERARDVVVAGQSLGGYTVLRTMLRYPKEVGGALAQSASLWQGDLAPLLDPAMARFQAAWIEVGRQEWALRDANRELAEKLSSDGISVTFNEYNGGHDQACWRGGIAEGLRFLLPRDVGRITRQVRGGPPASAS